MSYLTFWSSKSDFMKRTAYPNDRGVSHAKGVLHLSLLHLIRYYDNSADLYKLFCDRSRNLDCSTKIYLVGSHKFVSRITLKFKVRVWVLNEALIDASIYITSQLRVYIMN